MNAACIPALCLRADTSRSGVCCESFLSFGAEGKCAARCISGFVSGVRLRFAESNSDISIGWIAARCVGGGGRSAKSILRSPCWPQSFLKKPKCFKMLVLQVEFLHHHFQSPTLIGWAFSHLDFPHAVRGFRQFCVCHRHWRANQKTPAYPSSLTLFWSLFSKNRPELRQPSTRRNPFVTIDCH